MPNIYQTFTKYFWNVNMLLSHHLGNIKYSKAQTRKLVRFDF